MGRTEIIYGETGSCASGLDRFGGGTLETEEAWIGNPSGGLALAGGVLPQASLDQETHTAEAEVNLPFLWRDLPLAERQRFGHCFSALVLKVFSGQTTEEVTL